MTTFALSFSIIFSLLVIVCLLMLIFGCSMKKIAALFCLALLGASADAGEVWRREIFESGEIAYGSGYMGAFNTNFLMGERGVSVMYTSATGKSLVDGECKISIDDLPVEECMRVKGIFTQPSNIANRLANAKKVKLKIRICDNSSMCRWAIAGGKFEEISWEWDEPLSTTFPDFKSYPVK